VNNSKYLLAAVGFVFANIVFLPLAFADSVVATVIVGTGDPEWIGVNSVTNKIYVSDEAGGKDVSVINGATDTKVKVIAVLLIQTTVLCSC